MRNFFKTFLAAVILFQCNLSFAQETTYEKIIQAGKEELSSGNYDKAIRYFQVAQQLDDSSTEPQYYINLIKRAQDDRVMITREQSDSLYYSSQTRINDDQRRDKDISGYLDRVENSTTIKNTPVRTTVDRSVTVEKALDAYDNKPVTKKQDSGEKLVFPKPVAAQQAVNNEQSTLVTDAQDVIKKQTRISPQAVERTYDFTTATLSSAPINVEMFIDQSFIVKSTRIKRWLAVTEGFIDIQRLDSATIRVRGVNLGPTIFHVWDDTGRWTFSVQVVPLMRADDKKSTWDDAEGFKFYYENNWRGYYDGPNVENMHRSSLIFDQDAGVTGPTPYGLFDGSMQWSRSYGQNNIKGYTVGLTNGHFLTFNDFNIRGFDFSQAFSPLTFPGTTLRGGYFDSPMFNDGLEYSLLWGSDKRSYGYLTSDLISDQDSYIDGAKVKFFPKAKNSVEINYAHGRGSDRESYLKDKVYSVETKHHWGTVNVLNEVARDDENNAGTSTLTAHMGKVNARLSYRDISQDFLTISGRPSNSGEIGGTAGFDWRPTEKFYFSSDLDVYRDRQNFNNGNENGLNYDWNGSSTLTLTQTSSLNTSVYYSNDAQLSFPQRNLSGNATLNKSFGFDCFGKRNLSTYAGYSYQKSINPLSPGSDYLRNAALAGGRINLIRDLYAYGNYTYSWVEDLQADFHSNPLVWETGLDYSKNFGPKLATNWRVYYRNEENVESVHAFLAGEDSLEGSFSCTYAPYDGVQFFLDGRIRRIMPQKGSGVDRSVEGDIRLGTRLEWDSFFTWAPNVRVEGIVFKDTNGNGKLDKGEEGIEGVKVVVGPHTVTSGKGGKYYANVRARGVVATLDVNTMPKGYVSTSNSSVRLDTSRGGTKRLDFGLSSQSGIYGLVFYDVDGDGKFTPSSDKAINKAKISLDNKKSSFTNGEGAYFFGSLLSGKYTLTLDINSLPIEYIPAASVRQTVEISEGVTYALHFPLKKK